MESRELAKRKPAHASAGDCPVFIVGAPRSGTSLIYRTLALHPGAAWINNYQRRIPSATSLAALNRVASRARRTRMRVWFGEDGGNAYRYGDSRSRLDRWFPQPVEGEPLFRMRGIPEQSDQAIPEPGQLKLRKDFERIARYSAGKVVLSKRIGHNLRIPLLHGIFPNARFIEITRDGRAVAASLLRVDWWQEDQLWWFGGTPADACAQGLDSVLLGATHWVREVEAISSGLASVPADQVLHLRYEDLVDSPLQVLQKAAAFAGLQEDRRWVESLAKVKFQNQNAAWRELLADRADDVWSVQRDQLVARGYLD